ncbi:hypothetical protein GWI33_008446 [Rhynchophorus ferrugineus]|uniref:Uncharacterized protein n=1 Tax=Rhynchophorus ferrugineus TaxID=354439 RepID=A0A834II42_RHYFE|nr:hypothetical protein GWI33_008446 [Rhynchophorus ferrugineus]
MEKRQTRKKNMDMEQMEATETNEGIEAISGETDLDSKEEELTGLTMSTLIGMDVTLLKEKIKLCLDVIKGRATKIHHGSKKMRYGIGDRTVVLQTLQKIGDITDLMERKSKKQEQYRKYVYKNGRANGADGKQNCESRKDTTDGETNTSPQVPNTSGTLSQSPTSLPMPTLPANPNPTTAPKKKKKPIVLRGTKKYSEILRIAKDNSIEITATLSRKAGIRLFVQTSNDFRKLTTKLLKSCSTI